MSHLRDLLPYLSPAREISLEREVRGEELRADISTRKARLLHEEACGHELTEALADNANARSGPGGYVGELYEFTAKCRCKARRNLDCDGEIVWSEWRWSDHNCVEWAKEES